MSEELKSIMSDKRIMNFNFEELNGGGYELTFFFNDVKTQKKYKNLVLNLLDDEFNINDIDRWNIPDYDLILFNVTLLFHNKLYELLKDCDQYVYVNKIKIMDLINHLLNFELLNKRIINDIQHEYIDENRINIKYKYVDEKYNGCAKELVEYLVDKFGVEIIDDFSFNMNKNNRLYDILVENGILI
jgi:hypothetical protein